MMGLYVVKMRRYGSFVVEATTPEEACAQIAADDDNADLVKVRAASQSEQEAYYRKDLGTDIEPAEGK